MFLDKSKMLIAIMMMYSLIITGCKNQDLIKEDELNKSDKYVCSTNEFSDFIPVLLNSSETNENLVLNGFIQMESSDIVDGTATNTFIVDTILEKRVSDLLYVADYNSYITIECKNDEYNVNLYDESGANKKTIFSTDEGCLLELSCDADGDIAIPVYIIDSEDKIHIENIYKYDLKSEKDVMLDISHKSGFDTPDKMPVSLKSGDFNGYITSIYNNSTKQYSVVKYDDNFDYEFTFENNHNIVYLDDNYLGYSFTDGADQLLIHRVEDEYVETDIYDMKSGSYIDTIAVLQERNSMTYDGLGTFLYFFSENGSLKGVNTFGEVTDLFSTECIIRDLYEREGDICYAGYINHSNTDVVYTLNSDSDVAETTYVKKNGKNNLEYMFSFCDEDNNMFHLFQDENLQCYLNNVSAGEENLEQVLNVPDLNLYKYLTNSNKLCGVYYNDLQNYYAIIYDLTTCEEQKYDLGEFGINPEFYLKNESIYILSEDEKKNTIIHVYDFNTGMLNKLTEIEGDSYRFTLKSSEYDFCCYSIDGVYGYKENKLNLIFDWNKYCTIPEIFDVCVNNDSTYTIVGNDVKHSLNFYKFCKTNENIPEKQMVYLAENMGLNDIVGTESASSRLLNAIDEFNKNNSRYFIQTQYVTDEDLNIMLLSDSAPDIIVSRGSINPSILKITADLSERIPVKLKKDPYSCSLINLGKNDDEIHELFPEYLFITLYGEKQKLKNMDFSTVDSFTKNIYKLNSESVFYGITQMDLFNIMIGTNLVGYTDKSASSIKFDDKFIDLLEIIKNNAVPDSYRDMGDDELYNMYFSNSSERFSNDLCSFDISYMSLYLYNNMLEYGEIKDPLLIGIPSIDSACVPVSPEYSLSIIKSSDNIEGAWCFIETLFSDNYQDGLKTSMPVLHSSLKKQSKSLHINKKVYEQIENMIENNAVLSYNNESILYSISDNLNEYFNDEINGKELVRKIENKLNLYNSETE